MSAITIHRPVRTGSQLALIAAIDAEGRRRNAALWGAAVFFLALMLPTLAALFLDGRTINGVSVWVKPLKFEASIAFYLATLAWLWGYLAPKGWSRWIHAFAAVSIGLLGFEIAYIVLQSARGVGSHFNTATPIEGLMFTLMGLAAVVFTAFPAALGIALARHPAPGLAPAFRLAMVLGLILTAVFGIATGAAIAINGGHWVGAAATDAGGLPVFGWTRTGGDLRVAHFFALHALQVLPVAGWLIAQRRPDARAAVWILAAAFAALTLYTLGEALAGRPFLPFLG
jgi:hypothetical protein